MFCAGMLAHLLDNDERCVELLRAFAEKYEQPFDVLLDFGEAVCHIPKCTELLFLQISVYV